MYFSGILKTAPSIVNFHSDLVGLISGTITDVSQLSNNFISPNLINTDAAGWTISDSVAGVASNGVIPKVVSSPWSDNANMFKNILITTNSATNLAIMGYHTWNSVNHTGTFPTSAGGTVVDWQTIPMTAGNRIIISVSPNHILINVLASINGSSLKQTGVFEFTRDDPWRTLQSGYPAWLHMGASNFNGSNGSNASIPYAFDLISNTNITPALAQSIITTATNIIPGAGFVPNNLTCIGSGTAVSLGGSFLSGQNSNYTALNFTQGANANKTASKYAFDIYYRLINPALSYTQSIWLGGNISSLSPYIFSTHNSLGIAGDDLIIGNDTYLIIESSTTAQNTRTLIKKA